MERGKGNYFDGKLINLDLVGRGKGCHFDGKLINHDLVIIIIIIVNPLTARFIGAPQILQPVFSIFPCSQLPSGDLANSRPVHSLVLFSRLFLCLPCLLPPFTVPCKIVLARSDERET